jgi:hypothetical protein
MLKVVALVLIILVVAVLGYAATRPNTFRVERQASIHASPEKITALIQDFRQWSLWSPYERLDPSMQRAFGGPPNGKGAVYEWSGNGKAGAGRMEILDASASEVLIKLDFIKPFEGHNTAEFQIIPEDNATEVTWAMYGPSPFVAKLMGLFFNMDTMIGKDFETGLANLKAASET